MDKATDIVARLEEKFPAMQGTGNVQSERRIFIDAPFADMIQTIEFCKEELGFAQLCAITGLDTGEEYQFLYHISNVNGILLNLRIRTERDNVVLPSVLSMFNGAIFYELELEGLLGVQVDGLPDDRQYPLPDNWPKGQFPQRKDWQPPTDKTNP